MPTVKLSPVFNDQVVTSAGAPASGYLLYTYAAGSSSNQTTYTSSAGTVAQANPIVLNSNGAPDNPIWLTAGQSYKFVLKDPGGVTIRTVDNVAGVNDSSVSVSQWVSSGVTPTYVSASSFTLVGDQTTEFHVGRRVQCTVTAGTVYGVIATSAYTSLTTVTVTLDSGSLDSGLSAVNLSILRADNPALPKSSAVLASIGAVNKAGDTMTGALNAAATVTVASATTCDIGAAASTSVIISGTTTITGLGTIAAGAVRDVTFSGALTLTHNATSLILPTGANIATVAGDTASFVSLGSGNWRCVSYQRADGKPLQPLTLSTAQNTTSGTAIDFTGIPSWVRRITVCLNGVSLSAGTGVPCLQIGDSGGIENTGYVGAVSALGNSSGTTANLSSSVPLFIGAAAASVLHGVVTFNLLEASTNRWAFSGVVGRSDSTGTAYVAGTKALSATLDRVRLASDNGTDTFDAGSVNILYE